MITYLFLLLVFLVKIAVMSDKLKPEQAYSVVKFKGMMPGNIRSFKILKPILERLKSRLPSKPANCKQLQGQGWSGIN